MLLVSLMLLVDNKSGKVIPGRKKALMRELSLFSDEEDQPKVSQQLQLAILQYLNTGNSCCVSVLRLTLSNNYYWFMVSIHLSSYECKWEVGKPEKHKKCMRL